ncbi:putative membrane protein [Kitasatospora sp. GP30]|nr:putative membrane protein [Kitasatospora sp. GP30]
MMSGTAVVQVVIPFVILLTAWLMPALTGPTLPFGVRTPPAHADAPVVAEQRRAYRWWVGGVGGAVLVADLVCCLAFPSKPLFAGASTAIAAVSTVGYLRARRAIRAVKRGEDWYGGLRQVVAVDTSLRTEPVRYPWRWAVPALLVTAVTAVLAAVEYPSMPDRLPMHYATRGNADRLAEKSIGTAFAPVFIQLALTGLLLLVTWLVLRSRAELDPARPAASAARHRRFVVRTAGSVMVLGACVNLGILAAAWQSWHGDLSFSPFPVLAPIMAGLLIVVAIAARTGQGGSRLATGARDGAAGEPADPRVVAPDDDRYWRAGGLFYVNRQDPSLFVAKRFGIGWTINFGNPRCLLLVAGLAVFIVTLQLIGR